MESYAKPCMVLLMRVLCPSSARTGGVFSFASLANAAICGWATQFGTRICSRLLSYATACVLPNLNDTFPFGALRIVRNGRASPLAVNGYTVADELPRFVAHSSLFLVSPNIPVG